MFSTQTHTYRTVYMLYVWKLMVLKYVDALNIVKHNLYIEHECNNDSKIDWWN